MPSQPEQHSPFQPFSNLQKIFLLYPIVFLYTLAGFLIRFLFSVSALFSARARKFRRVRIQAKKEFQKMHPDLYQGKSVYWFHGASVGELDQAKALGRELKANEPHSFLVMSWISDSVTEKNLKDSPADLHIPLPLDGPFSYNLYFKSLKPKKTLVFAWDAWLYFLLTAKKYDSEVYLACATLSETSGRMGTVSRIFTRFSFSQMDGILPAHVLHEPRIRELLESKDSLQDFSHIPTEPNSHSGREIASKTFIHTLGDTRFDSVIQKMENLKPPESFPRFIEKWQAISQEQTAISGNIEDSSRKGPNTMPILFASTYPICETAILDYAQSLPAPRPIWIFPHKIETKRIQRLVESFQAMDWRAQTYSDYNNAQTLGSLNETIQEKNQNSLSNPSVVVFDELGILAFAYRYGLYAYVGGAMHHRVHNTIEPGYWSLPLLTGPKIFNSSEAMVMEELGGLKKCESPQAMKELLQEWEGRSEEDFARQGKINHDFVMENKGASKRIYQRIWKE